MEAFVATLSGLPTAAQGEVFEPLAPGVKSAELRYFPSIKDGPCVREVSGRHLRFEEVKDAPIGIDLSRIDAKIAKYKEGWGVRAELLAFARWGMPFSEQQHRAPEYLAERLPAGIFQRGWIFEVASQIVVACAPR